MTRAESDRTVGFFDLSARTRSGPDRLTRTAVQARLAALSAEVSAVGGRVIKQIGDELMCTFTDPSEAVDIATVMEAALDDLVGDGLQSHLRIGLHCGPVVEEGGDVFGDTVNTAARMTSIAGAGQIITTEDVVACLPEEQRDCAKLFDRVKIKGSRRERSIYRVLWSPRAETLGGLPVVDQSSIMDRTLVVTYGEVSIRMEVGGEDIRLGRDDRVELVVRSEMASRFHAMIGSRRGKFVLKDQSTNGTYVSMQGSPVVELKREELPLFGEGVISLGEAVRDDGEHLIRFAFD